MIEDCIEFNLYGIRKGCLEGFLQMIDFQENVYSSKYYFSTEAVKLMIKAILKIQKMTSEQLEKVKSEEQEYLASEKHKEFLKKYEKREDDDPMKWDMDKFGFQGLFEAHDLKKEVGLQLAMNVAKMTA